jgi:hypothetical protein
MGKWIVGILFFLVVAPGIAMLALPEESYTQPVMAWFAPKPEAALARQYIDAVRTGQYAVVENALDPEYVTTETPALLARISAQFPEGRPKSVKLVGTNTFHKGDVTTYTLRYEYEYPQRWLVGNVVLRKAGGKHAIAGLHVTPIADSLEHVNAFTLAGKRPIHYAFLAATIAIVLFVFVTAFVCLSTPIPRRRWLWVLFVLLGFFSVTLNWSTGAVGFQPISVVLFGASLTKAFYGPWILKLALPAGAIVFWSQRGRWLEKAEKPGEAPHAA